MDYVELLGKAKKIVEESPVRRFMDGTPLYNDIPVMMTDFVVAQNEWQAIETAPKENSVRIDLWAKCWLPAFDEFAFQRFPNCYWYKGDSMCNVDSHWMNLDKNWHATHWMNIPSGPEK
jgi:hypothetical protein